MIVFKLFLCLFVGRKKMIIVLLENLLFLNLIEVFECIFFSKEDLVFVKVIKVVCYIVLILFLFLGNVVVIVVKNRYVWNIMNYLIRNMVVLDLFIFVFVVFRELR